MGPKAENGDFLENYSKNSDQIRFEDFTAVTMKNNVFWDVTPCGS
jgi:hypothetical protein